MEPNAQLPSNATPLEKLAASRLALQQSLHPQTYSAKNSDAAENGAAPRRPLFSFGGGRTRSSSRSQPSASKGTSTWSQLMQIGGVMGNVAQRRWRSHPARLAADVARPVLMQEARKHPVRLLAIAAGAGAAVVLLKPWRWKAPERYLRSTAAMELRRIASAGFGVALAQLLGRKI